MRADHRKLAIAMTKQFAEEIAKARESQEWRAQTVEDLLKEKRELVQAIASDYTDKPSPALTELVQHAVSADLNKRVQDSYKSRDRAMAAIGRVFEVHHETLTDKCNCGKPLTSCREYKTVEFFRESYERWERRQFELMRQDKYHGLPADHPAARKLYRDRWSWKGAPPIERLAESKRSA
jgi:hypothetical protein